LEVKTLWVQRLVEDKIVAENTVLGEENIADIGTQLLPASRMRFLKEFLSIGTLQEAKHQTTQKRVAVVSSVGKRGLFAMLAASPPGARGELIACGCSEAWTGQTSASLVTSLAVMSGVFSVLVFRGIGRPHEIWRANRLALTHGVQ